MSPKIAPNMAVSSLTYDRFRWQKDTTNRRAKGQRAGDKLRTQLFLIVFKQQRIDLIDVIDFVFQAIPHDPVPAELDKSELFSSTELVVRVSSKRTVWVPSL